MRLDHLLSKENYGNYTPFALCSVLRGLPCFEGGLSSAGRAPALHAGGQRFDPARLHNDRRSLLLFFENWIEKQQSTPTEKRVEEVL